MLAQYKRLRTALCALREVSLSVAAAVPATALVFATCRLGMQGVADGPLVKKTSQGDVPLLGKGEPLDRPIHSECLDPSPSLAGGNAVSTMLQVVHSWSWADSAWPRAVPWMASKAVSCRGKQPQQFTTAPVQQVKLP